MKILLSTLNAKYIHSNLALKYLYGVVADSGMDISIREFTINNEKDYIFTEILRGGYDLVCFSCYIWNIEQIKELSENLKKACPTMTILLGGPEVSFDAVRFLEDNPWADYIIRGEGEYPFFTFCKDLFIGGLQASEIPNLTYRNGDEICETEDGPLPKMEKLPFPYQRLPLEDDKIIYYESSRGCPYRCTYCLSSLDTRTRPLPMDRVKKEIDFFLEANVRQVKFIDRTFNFDRDRALQIWSYIIEHDNGKTNFHFEICADLIDNMTINVLGRARKGLFQFEVGLQTTNMYSLDAVCRKNDTARTCESIMKLISLRNCHVHVDLIAGLPLETYETFATSFNRAYQLGADNLQLGFLKLLPGTKIREEAESYHYIYRSKAPYEVISTETMSAIDLLKLKMIETVLELYHNRGGFTKTLRYIIPIVANSPFNFYERLADFFYTRGYQNASHKKEDLYRILLEFATSLEYLEHGLTINTKIHLNKDLQDTMNEEAVKQFQKKGWSREN